MIKILDGKKIATKLGKVLKEKTSNLKKRGKILELAVILVGENPASKVYVKQKKEFGKKLGINVKVFKYKNTVTEKDIISKIYFLNKDEKTNGIIVQLPLPKKLNTEKIIKKVSPKKDIDGFNSKIEQPTALAVLEVLDFYKLKIIGQKILVIGRGRFGEAIAQALKRKGGKVKTADINTKNMKEVSRKADILISVVGKANLVKRDMIKAGAIVIDVGTSRKGKKIFGDVDFKKVSGVASFITPVPGGVGPVTVLKLLENVIRVSAKK